MNDKLKALEKKKQNTRVSDDGDNDDVLPPLTFGLIVQPQSVVFIALLTI